MLEMCFTIGWRRGEVLALTVNDVNLAENYIRTHTKTKNGSYREVPLTQSMRVLVEALVMGKTPEGHLIPIQDLRTV